MSILFFEQSKYFHNFNNIYTEFGLLFLFLYFKYKQNEIITTKINGMTIAITTSIDVLNI